MRGELRMNLLIDIHRMRKQHDGFISVSMSGKLYPNILAHCILYDLSLNWLSSQPMILAVVLNGPYRYSFIAFFDSTRGWHWRNAAYWTMSNYSSPNTWENLANWPAATGPISHLTMWRPTSSRAVQINEANGMIRRYRTLEPLDIVAIFQNIVVVRICTAIVSRAWHWNRRSGPMWHRWWLPLCSALSICWTFSFECSHRWCLWPSSLPECPEVCAVDWWHPNRRPAMVSIHREF